MERVGRSESAPQLHAQEWKVVRFFIPPLVGRAIAYDQLQPTLVASHSLSAGRPCERRDPSPLASKVKKGLCSSAETSVRAAAMSAIALTLGSLRSQGRLIENSICDSPAHRPRRPNVDVADDLRPIQDAVRSGRCAVASTAELAQPSALL